MDVLTKCLHDLSSDTAGVSAKDLVAQIEAFASSSELQGVDLQFVSNLLLQSDKSPPSLLRFIVGTVSNTDLKDAKRDALKVLAKYVKDKGVLLQDCAAVVFRTLTKYFHREDSNELKSECIPVLMNLLRTCAFTAADVDLAASSAARPAADRSKVGGGAGMFHQFFDALQDCKKSTSASLRGNLYKLVGMLVRVFGEEDIVKNEGANVVVLCLKVCKRPHDPMPACLPVTPADAHPRPHPSSFPARRSSRVNLRRTTSF